MWSTPPTRASSRCASPRTASTARGANGRASRRPPRPSLAWHGSRAGRTATPSFPAVPTDDGRRAAHDQVETELSAWTATREVDELVELLARHAVPAAAVVDARDIAFNPQLAARGFFEVEDHPVTGPHPVPVMPFRFASRRTEGWMRRPSPTVGQHNDEVLRELGLADADLAGLRERAIIGERPLGA